MNTKKLGRTGLSVSEICLGTMTFGNQCDEATSFAIMDKAYEAGVFFFDTADVSLKQFFSARNRSLTEVALAWVLAQPGITCAILGASRPEQLDQSLAGATLRLAAEELEVCNQIWFDLPRLKDPAVALR